MTIEQLSHFIAAAKHLNFSKAADSLFVNQSSISRSVKLIEEEFGVTLFERSNRGLKITDAGQTLYHEGEKVISSFESLRRLMCDSATGVLGHITVTSVRAYHYPML